MKKLADRKSYKGTVIPIRMDAYTLQSLDKQLQEFQEKTQVKMDRSKYVRLLIQSIGARENDCTKDA